MKHTSKRLLKPFSLEVTFSPDGCLEDKIDVRLGAWSVSLPKESFFYFKQFLACPPKDLREHAFGKKRGQPSMHGAVFCRPEMKGAKWKKLQIRSQSLKHPDGRQHQPLLFGGYVFIGNRSPRGTSKNRRPIYAHLSLNLARFIRHQPRQEASMSEAVSNPDVRLRQRDSDRSTFEGESALDGKDNWIPNESGWMKYARGSNSAKHLHRYVQAVRRKLENEFKRADKVVDFQTGENGYKKEREYYSLRAVEHAWEFASNDVIGDVELWGERIANLYEKRLRDDFAVPKKRRVEWIRNAPCFHVNLAKNVSLRLYAKTSKRIRFEVIHTNVNWSSEIRAAKNSKPKSSSVRHDYSQDVRSLNDLMCVFQRLRDKSAKTLGDVMEELREKYAEGMLYRPFVDLVAEVAGAVPEECTTEDRARLTRTMIRILCGQKGFRGNARVGELAPMVTRLKNSGVFRWCSRRRFYKLHADFSRAAEAFQKTSEHFNSLLGGSTKYRKYFVSRGREVRDRVRGGEA